MVRSCREIGYVNTRIKLEVVGVCSNSEWGEHVQ